jgi:hypothetical protein
MKRTILYYIVFVFNIIKKFLAKAPISQSVKYQIHFFADFASLRENIDFMGRHYLIFKLSHFQIATFSNCHIFKLLHFQIATFSNFQINNLCLNH